MTTRFVGAGLAILAIGLFAAGCGDDNDRDKSSGAAAPAEEQDDSARTACKKPATTKETGLPAAFPISGELTITQVRKDGPTNVVDGYWTSELEEAYAEFKDHVEQAGYKILFTEMEEHDAEISYSGSNRTGQIAFRDDCSEDATLRVHITNRPA